MCKVGKNLLTRNQGNLFLNQSRNKSAAVKKTKIQLKTENERKQTWFILFEREERDFKLNRCDKNFFFPKFSSRPKQKRFPHKAAYEKLTKAWLSSSSATKACCSRDNRWACPSNRVLGYKSSECQRKAKVWVSSLRTISYGNSQLSQSMSRRLFALAKPLNLTPWQTRVQRLKNVRQTIPQSMRQNKRLRKATMRTLLPWNPKTPAFQHLQHRAKTILVLQRAEQPVCEQSIAIHHLSHRGHWLSARAWNVHALMRTKNHHDPVKPSYRRRW